ncbi:MAG: hypothetical protein ACKVTZ_17040 [Bacteroidia bacterium]
MLKSGLNNYFFPKTQDKMPVVRAALAALHWQKRSFCADAAAEAAATKVRLVN